jgi:hypothetical protein
LLQGNRNIRIAEIEGNRGGLRPTWDTDGYLPNKPIQPITVSADFDRYPLFQTVISKHMLYAELKIGAILNE